MLEKIIVGIDGLQGGRDAVALARTLAPTGELVLVAAFPFDNTPSRFTLIGYGNTLRHETEQLLKRAAREAGVENARTVAVPDTSPARALQRAAAEERADLIVVGAAHHGGTGRIFLGDVARSVLHGAPCPVAVAPHGATPQAIATVGVGFDDTAEARQALRCAGEIARRHGARVRALDVTEPTNFAGLAGYAPNVDSLYEEQRADAQHRLDEALAELPVAAEGLAVIDLPALALGRFAAAVDLMVVGSRAYGPFRRVVLGSTADRLMHHSPAPVVVVPRGANVITTPVDEGARGIASPA